VSRWTSGWPKMCPNGPANVGPQSKKNFWPWLGCLYLVINNENFMSVLLTARTALGLQTMHIGTQMMTLTAAYLCTFRHALCNVLNLFLHTIIQCNELSHNKYSVLLENANQQKTSALTCKYSIRNKRLEYGTFFWITINLLHRSLITPREVLIFTHSINRHYQIRSCDPSFVSQPRNSINIVKKSLGIKYYTTFNNIHKTIKITY